MKYKRLVAFGCSLTYGDGLDDCYDPITKLPGEHSSRYSWPEILGNKLKIEKIINRGYSGASNKLIWKNIIDYNFNLDDLVIIMWTFPERHCIFNNETDSIHIGPWGRKISTIYYEYFYSSFDHTVDDSLRIDHINFFLQNKGITCYNSLYKKRNQLLPWCSASFLKTHINDHRDKFPTANDNLHPGPDAHIQIATDIYNEIIGDINE